MTDAGNFPASEISYLDLVIIFSVIVYVINTYLDFRQLKAISKPSPPAPLRDSYSPVEYRKTQDYQLDKWYFNFFSGVFNHVLELTMLSVFYLPWLWGKSESVTQYLASKISWLDSSEIPVTIVFFLLDGAKDTLISLPFSLYHTFVLEQTHGFNKQTLGLFVLDFIKSTLLGLLLGPPIVAGFTWILQRTSAYMPLYLWAFFFGLQIFFMTIYPVFIAPLFNKFSPLEEGTLRTAIEELAGSLKFPLTKLFVVDGSTRSAHSNAYMYGFFKNKRIVLYDTLIDQCKEDQVVAVLAHELGHWKLGHTLKNLVLTQMQMLCTFALFSLVRTSKGLFTSFGFVNQQPAFIAYTLFSIISAPVNEVVGLLTNILSRRFEFQADAFAVSLGKGEELKEALKILDAKNRSAVNVDAWYSAYHHSHPPLVERLTAVDAATKKEE
ncbi:CAAX prenyl protease 1 homolog [Coccomyxa sp. Obi]|nr:CAAX prenyl protease 1 homolog [Coccomyxa sp. Obi]